MVASHGVDDTGEGTGTAADWDAVALLCRSERDSRRPVVSCGAVEVAVTEEEGTPRLDAREGRPAARPAV
jgi:hypothetical protein